MQLPMQEGSFNTAHSNSYFETIRIIRPHHPFFGKTFPLVRTWKHKKRHFYIIQLPDMSHIQIPIYWADTGKTPLPENISEQPIFTVNAIREFVSVLSIIGNKS